MSSSTAADRIPVSLISGFLGSGKTTLVRRILTDSSVQGETVGVIVNEFGALGVDGDLIVRRSPEASSLVELANGCICCEIQEDLRGALLAMSEASRRRSGGFGSRGWGLRRRQPPLTRILIEASGAASPGPAVQTFLVDGDLEEHVSLNAVITLVHAEHVESALLETEEAGPQIAYADRVIVGHADRVDSAECSRIVALVRDLNPLADVRSASHGDVPLAWIFDGLGGGSQGAAAHEHIRDIAPVTKHTDGLSSISLRASAPIDLAALRMWLEFLAKRTTSELMRCKGILAGEGGAVVAVQGVYRWLEIQPVEGDVPTVSGLVLIGRGLDRSEVERGWEAVQAAST